MLDSSRRLGSGCDFFSSALLNSVTRSAKPLHACLRNFHSVEISLLMVVCETVFLRSVTMFDDFLDAALFALCRHFVIVDFGKCLLTEIVLDASNAAYWIATSYSRLLSWKTSFLRLACALVFVIVKISVVFPGSSPSLFRARAKCSPSENVDVSPSNP